MKFYNGQPVVCVRSRSDWTMDFNARVMGLTESDIPMLGRKYVVAGYGRPDLGYQNHVLLHGHGHFCYHEDGFVPVTDELVRSIIEEAKQKENVDG